MNKACVQVHFSDRHNLLAGLGDNSHTVENAIEDTACCYMEDIKRAYLACVLHSSGIYGLDRHHITYLVGLLSLLSSRW